MLSARVKGEALGPNASMATDESQEQKRGHSGSTQGRKTVHFATLMGICHLKNSELEPQFLKCKGRVVLQGDTVKDDSGPYAVFTEQGSSASQMTAVKKKDVIAMLKRCRTSSRRSISVHAIQNGRCGKKFQIGHACL